MNIRSFTLLIFAAAYSGVGAATHDHTHSATVDKGCYRLIVSEESRSLATLAGDPIPAGSLSITDDHLFVFDTNIGKRLTHREGRVDADGDDIVLSFGDDLHMKGHLLEDGTLDISGLHFAKRETGPIVGQWHVKKMDACLEFFKEGNFKFKCTGATSEGNYKSDGGVITLTWTLVDGEAVDPDTMHKKLILDDEGTFWIDNYHYKKD
jgi:hypothetical protein